MSRTVSAGLQAHLEGETLTVATLWRITRTDAQVFGFTDHSRDITYDGTAFSAAMGHTLSSIKTSSGLAVDNLEVAGVIDSSIITEADIAAGLWDFAEVEILIVNYADLTMGHMQLRRGWLGEITTAGSGFRAELRGMMQALQQTTGRVFSKACDAVLGDARCAKSLAAFTVTGTVDSAASARVFTDAARTEADNYFAGGLITWTGGANNGYAMEIKSSTALGVVSLQQGMPNMIAAGDTYSMIAGCDGTLATCRDTFNNVINFRGFPSLPGDDRLVSGI